MGSQGLQSWVLGHHCSKPRGHLLRRQPRDEPRPAAGSPADERPPSPLDAPGHAAVGGGGGGTHRCWGDWGGSFPRDRHCRNAQSITSDELDCNGQNLGFSLLLTGGKLFVMLHDICCLPEVWGRRGRSAVLSGFPTVTWNCHPGPRPHPATSVSFLGCKPEAGLPSSPLRSCGNHVGTPCCHNQGRLDYRGTRDGEVDNGAGVGVGGHVCT